MSVRFALVAALVALAALPAAGQQSDGGYLPLERVAKVRAPRRPLKERLFDFVQRATRPLPHMRGLVPKTRGDMRLGVLLVEFADTLRPEFRPGDWDAALFSRGTYTKRASGERAYGSLRDYYLENSSGALDVTGRIHDWVAVPQRRADLEPRLLVDPTGRRMFTNAIDGVLEREGRDAFRGCDALVFVIAGDQARERGSVLWPHSGLLFHRGRAWRYYLMHAGTKRFEPIGVHCHELGHVLGVLDKYGMGPGTGLGQWCLMAQGGHGGRSRGVDLDAPAVDPRDKLGDVVRDQLEQLRKRLPGQAPRSAGESRPLHLCGVCKDRLGWSQAAVLDPRDPQRISLRPVEGDANQVVRVLLDPRGRESVYLEYRAQAGFDVDLPRAGLLVWRTGSPTAALRTFVPVERCELVPAHGVESVDAPQRALAQIPFPAAGKTAVTVPGTLSGSWAVELSEIAEANGELRVRIALAD